jgi:hypothetical protein
MVELYILSLSLPPALRGEERGGGEKRDAKREGRGGREAKEAKRDGRGGGERRIGI